MSKFTPGPWKTEVIYPDGDYQCRIMAEDKKIIVGEPNLRGGPANIHWKPNAELIAIAPDMYKFLSDLIKYPESIDPIQFMGLKEEAHRIIKGVE